MECRCDRSSSRWRRPAERQLEEVIMPETCRRILAIVRKDVRHLWPHAIIFAAVLVFAAISDPTYTRQGSPIYHFYVMYLGLPLACWNLVVGAVQQERLVGDRQYWLTR